MFVVDMSGSISEDYFKQQLQFLADITSFFDIGKTRVSKHNTSRVMTKPTKWVYDQHGSRPACASAQCDQDSCCSLLVSLLVIGCVSEQHGSWSDCADAQNPCRSQTHCVGFDMSRPKWKRRSTDKWMLKNSNTKSKFLGYLHCYFSHRR
jgi:hypothetical protein